MRRKSRKRNCSITLYNKSHLKKCLFVLLVDLTKDSFSCAINFS